MHNNSSGVAYQEETEALTSLRLFRRISFAEWTF